MPRWIWALLSVMVLALVWAGRKPGGDVPSTPDFACPSPPLVASIDAPLQSSVPSSLGAFKRDDATITPLAGYSVEAKIMAREDYSFDEGAQFSPTDLALGWGPMSREETYKALNISQSGRWYFYSWAGEPPLEQNKIVSNSANHHIVPGNAQVASALAALDEDQQVRLDGWLIKIDRPDGWHWQSSLSRDDSGDGSCELFYVCAIEVK